MPLARRFERAGHSVVITARDYGDTLRILESEHVEHVRIGHSFGRGLPRKVKGLVARAWQLDRFLRRQDERVEIVLTGSRSGAVTARKNGIPSFVIVDYEYADLSVFRLTAAAILFPRVIDAHVLQDRGIAPERLIAFDGLKEDISFADTNVAAVPPHRFDDGDSPRILFRPPAEESHYYRGESRELAVEMLRYLASCDARVVFAPRAARQERYLEEVSSWAADPIVLHEPLPFVALLKGVDAVVSAGGTMLREAAYLGVPAYSIFRSRIGAVDRYLESIGRLLLLRSPADFDQIKLTKRPELEPLDEHASVADDIMNAVIAHAARADGR